MQLMFTLIVHLSIGKVLALNVNETNYRIFKGLQAANGQFPYMVFIVALLEEYFTCSGFLVKLDTILTASHCFHDDDPVYFEFKPEDIVLMVGEADAVEYLNFRLLHSITIPYKKSPFLQESLASQYYMHPRYKLNTNYDAAIVKIARAFTETKFVKPISITYDELSKNTECTIVGFGTNHLDLANVLMYFTTREVFRNPSECGSPNDEPELYCIRKDTRAKPSGCTGDSGGPLVCAHKVYGIYVQVAHSSDIEDHCGILGILEIFKLSASDVKDSFLTKYVISEKDSHSTESHSTESHSTNPHSTNSPSNDPHSTESQIEDSYEDEEPTSKSCNVGLHICVVITCIILYSK